MPPARDANRLDRNELRDTLDALDRLMRMFAAERYIYLLLAVISFGTLLIFAYQLFVSEPSIVVLTAVFGGSGLVAATSARITWFFNRAFSLIERVIEGARHEQ